MFKDIYIKGLAPVLGAVILFLGQAAMAEVEVHGSTTVASNVMLPMELDIERLAGQPISVIANGSSRGLVDLLMGEANIAMISAPLSEVEGKLPPALKDSPKLSHLVAHEIGKTRVAFVVHPSNTVSFLKMEQIAGIVRGKITNWREVGGPDLPISVVAEFAGGGTRTVVLERFNKEGDLPATTKVVQNAPLVAKVVGQLPEGFGILSAASVVPEVKALRSDAEIVQPLILVTLEPTAPETKAVVEAATKAYRGAD